MNEKNGVRLRIIDILRKHPEGLTINEISSFLETSRVTIAKYVYGLLLEKIIRQRNIGPAKMCYLCDKYAKN